MSMVEVINVSKQYDNGKHVIVKALSNINLKINTGEFIAIVGPSGSGKSTLLNLLGGLDKADEGIIKINSRNMSELSEEELADFRCMHVGFIFQKFNLMPMLTVKENIVLPTLLAKKKPDEQYIDFMIQRLGLQDRAEHMPCELSGGQQQRVGIGRALANQPDILLADEPTGNLDQKTSEEIMELLFEMNQQLNQTVIMITHDMALAQKADRIIRIIDGKI